MKKTFIIVFLTLFSLLFIFIIIVLFNVNKEDHSYVSNYEKIDAKDVKEKLKKNKKFYLIISTTTCPGKIKNTPILIENCSLMKLTNIPFLIISEELYNFKIDKKINNFKKDFNFKEKIYILNPETYPENGGLFNDKKRYDDFLIDLIGKNHNVPLGYVMYLEFENGKFIKINNGEGLQKELKK